MPDKEFTKKILKGGVLIDGKGGKPLADPVIVIEGDKIKEVRSGDHPSSSDAIELIDVGDRTILPGLIDCHVHLAAFNCSNFHNYRVAFWEVTPQLQSFYALYHAQQCFERGITTVRDLGRGTSRGTFVKEICAVRDAINAGIVAGPRMIVGGRVMITGSHFDLLTMPRAAERPKDFTADGPWDLRKHVRQNFRAGCDVIKTCVTGGLSAGASHGVRNMTQEELNAIVDEAHAFGIPCSVHCFTPDGQRMCVEAGVDTIEHMVLTDEDAVKRISDSGIHVIPTLAHRSDRAIDLRQRAGAPNNLIKRMKRLQPHCFETFEMMRDAGVKIAMGTDTGIDPKMGENSDELSIYVRLGMTEMEAIQSATKHAAEALNLDKELGTLEEGKLADIIVIDGNPLDDIQVLQNEDNINIVMKGGEIWVDKLHDSKKLVLPPRPMDWQPQDIS